MTKRKEISRELANRHLAQASKVSSTQDEITAEKAVLVKDRDNPADRPGLPDIGVQRDPETGKLTFAMPQERDKYAMAKAAMAKATGTAYDALAKELITLTAQAIPPAHGQEQKFLESIFGALMEISPHDCLEAMLGLQLFTTHKLIMGRLSRLYAEGQSLIGADMRIAQATKLMRLFTQQLETLQRYRNRGKPQVVRVEKVVVRDRAQAIVGNVERTRGGSDGQ